MASAPELDETVVLDDGRELGYAALGRRDRETVFQFHGSPAGRLDRWGDDSVLDDLAVRLVTMDGLLGEVGADRLDDQAGNDEAPLDLVRGSLPVPGDAGASGHRP
jgi:hypothetical protein